MFVRNRSGFALPALAAVLSGVAALLPAGAWALGLGDIHLKSALDAPLSADIDVVDANADDLSTLKAALASRDTVSKFGADYPAFLGTLTFTPVRSADGQTVLHVTSSGVADEPFATLLIEADWARGHVVREYTVLLDPPVFNSNAASNAAISAPSVDTGSRGGSIERAQPTASTAASNPPPAAVPTTGAAAAAAATPASAPAAPKTASNAGSARRARRGSAGAKAAAAAAAAEAGSDTKSAAAASSSTPTTANGAAANGAAANGAAGGSYSVKAGDTLSSIAAQTYAPADRRARDQALVAIYRANPKAFAGKNMNVLRAGSVLALPGDDEITAVGPGEASTEVRQQYAAWRSARAGAGAATEAANGAAGTGGAGQLRLVAPGESAQEAPASSSDTTTSPAAGNGTAGAGNAALRQQVQQLQSQLNDANRRLQLQNAQLADMQQRLQQAAAATPATAPAAPPAASAPASPPVAQSAPPPAVTAAPVPPAATTNPNTAAAPPVPAAPAVKPPAHRPLTVPPRKLAPSSSLLGSLLQYWWALVVLGVLAIALLTVRMMRSRKEDAFDRSLGRMSTPMLDEPELTNKPRSDTMPVRTMGTREEPAYKVEESGTHQRPVFDEPVNLGDTGGQRVSIDEGMTGEVPVALDQGDPLAEADFHMAYGLYDQAAELVQNAIAREPQRRDLKLKLLEVYFVWGNKDRFLQSAHELASSRSQAPAGEWEKIVIMGRQIAPEDALFADARAVAGAASAGVDLNLEGGQNRVDFDLLGEPQLAAASPDGAVDLDLGTALGSSDPDRTNSHLGANDATGEAKGPSSVDFDLDNPALSTETTGSTLKMPGSANSVAATREMPAVASGARGLGDTERVAVGGADLTSDAPTVEQPQLRRDPNETIRQKLDAAARSSLLTGEQTAELAIDDLGLDLGALETHTEEREVSADAPTMLAEVDPAARQKLSRADSDRAESGGTTQVRAAPGSPMRATGTWMFTDTDFAKMAPVKGPQSDVTQQARTEIISHIAEPAPVDTSSTSRLAALDASDLDLDLSSLSSLNDQAEDDVDLDVGSGSRQNGAGTNGHEEGLPDLEPVTLSEVGTKLDLARAYMDMGDPEGARSILSEVLSEGSLSQKQEARRLMDALPG